MTIFGVAGSVALLFAGLGIQSSVGGVPQRQFGEILKYDMILSTKSSLTDEEEHSLKKILKRQKLSLQNKWRLLILPDVENKA